jgi:hypothetical protein
MLIGNQKKLFVRSVQVRGLLLLSLAPIDGEDMPGRQTA